MGNLYSRVDILKPTGEGEWDLIEVKSSTSVKDVHLHDVSFQKVCCEKYGLRIRKCFLMYINNKYIKSGPIDPEAIFSTEDITAKVDVISYDIQERIDVMLRIMSSPNCPDAPIGKHCSDPSECPLKDYCWAFLPEYNIFKLYYGGKKSFDLFSNGVITIKEIPDSYKLNDKQRIQQACEISGKPHVDGEGISNFLGTLQYPLYYLDFETIGPAVPLFDGTRPYQAIPFQFSLFVAENDGSRPKHFSFLASSTDDFRPTFLSELKNVLGDTGSIVVYNQGFEEGILKELALAFPEYDGWVNQVRERFVDLLSPFRQFQYYNPLHKGSVSLKSVLPALTGQGYEDLDISDGMEASIAFQSVTYSEVPAEEKEKVLANLEAYCKLDTEGMIWIINKLREISGN